MFDFLPLRPHPRIKGRKSVSDADRENFHDDATCGYYPFVSVYGGGIATLNPGPDFRYPPASLASHLSSWKPLSARYDEFMAEQRAWDEREEEDAQVHVDREEAAHAKAEAAAARPKKKSAPFAIEINPLAGSPAPLQPVSDAAISIDRVPLIELSVMQTMATDAKGASSMQDFPAPMLLYAESPLSPSLADAHTASTRMDGQGITEEKPDAAMQEAHYEERYSATDPLAVDDRMQLDD